MELQIRLGDFKVDDEKRKLILDVLNSGRMTENKYTKLFEEDFAKFIGVKYCISCTNGTAGLMLVLKSLQIIKKRPLNFMVPATTFPATLNSVLLTGNKAVLCDVGTDLLIDVNEEIIVKKKIDGIIPVHLLGYTCNMLKLRELKKKFLEVKFIQMKT